MVGAIARVARPTAEICLTGARRPTSHRSSCSAERAQIPPSIHPQHRPLPWATEEEASRKIAKSVTHGGAGEIADACAIRPEQVPRAQAGGRSLGATHPVSRRPAGRARVLLRRRPSGRRRRREERYESDNQRWAVLRVATANLTISRFTATPSTAAAESTIHGVVVLQSPHRHDDRQQGRARQAPSEAAAVSGRWSTSALPDPSRDRRVARPP